MARDAFYTAIDLGTTKVCTIIAKIGAEGELKVLGTGIVPCQGIQKGRVESIPETQDAVKASLEAAQRYLGRSISWAYLGVTGNHISCINTTGVLRSSRENGAISSLDVQNLIESSYPDVADSKEVLHVIPMSYAVDGLTGVRNPLGLHADRVEVESHVVLGDAPTLKNLVKVVEGRKLSVRSLVLQPLAAGEAVLTEDEREIGTVLVDIGGGTTDVMIYNTGSPWYTAVIPVGGNQLTRDLSIALGSPFYIAEDLKVRWGHAIPDAVASDEEIYIPGFQGQPRRAVRRRAMCQPLHERLTETLKLILLQLRQAGLRQLPPGGMVITGGTSDMPGLQDLIRELTGANRVRIAHPAGIMGLPSQLKKPAFSTSVGTLLWGIKHQGEKRSYRNGDQTLKGRSFLPGQKSLAHRFGRKTEGAST
jgi:cell division protein FtsA